MRRLPLCKVGSFGMIFLVLVILPAMGVCKESIRIGIMRDLTGAHSEAGRNQADAQQMIFDEINEKGGILGHKIVYTIADEKASPDRAASLAKRFINVDNVLHISGPTTSGAALAALRIASEAGVSMLSHAYANECHKGEMAKWFFASSLNNEEFFKASLLLAKKDGFKKVGVMWVNYVWGRDGRDVFYKFAEEYGITIVGDVAVELGASEATAEVRKMKSMNPEAIVSVLITKDQAAVLRGLAALNWRPPYYGVSPIAEHVLKIVGPEIMEGYKGAYFCDPYEPVALKIFDKFKAKYGRIPSGVGYFMETYDPTIVFVHVLETMIKNGEPLTRSNLRDAMEKYSQGVDLLIPKPRKSPGWGKPPHILMRAEDLLPMVVKGGKIVKY